ncbi:MAG: SCP-like extracellular [Sphingomonadales bacterium]|nr:MAG: SCP-like extracellular [Sphingomonadales bacterium]
MNKAIALISTAVLAGSGIAAVATANDGAVVSRPANRFAAELLDTHNVERARFGAQPLAWSPKLAREAQSWAHRLATEGRMRHASNDERGGAGENLWMGSAGSYDASFMVEAFIEERQHFHPGTFPQVSRTGDWRDVGHYTQVVWPTTREVGCAVARNSRDDFLVCRYWPAGNTYGVEIR